MAAPEALAGFEALRSLPFAKVVAGLGLHAKEDHSYTPRSDAARAGTRRYHVGGSDMASVRELLVTGELWFDVREREGGRGAIDLAMHLLGIDFRTACERLKGIDI